MIKGIIFDLDGVLVHTDKYHYLAWKQLADRENIIFNEEINHLLRGVSRIDSLNIILRNAKKDYSEAAKNEMADYKNNRYRQYLSTMTSNDVSNDVVETLIQLRNNGLKLAIGSASKNASFIIRQTGLDAYIDAVSDGNNIIKSKPDPEVFIKASDYLGLKPSQCLVVEDARAGIEAALRGGFISVGINQATFHESVDYKIISISDLVIMCQ